MFSLNPAQSDKCSKEERVNWFKELLKKYAHSASKAVYNIYTCDESWIYGYEFETKQQSTVWVFQDEPNQQKLFAEEAH